MSQLNEDTLAEFKGQLIDALEDYLAEEGVTPSMLPNKECEEDDDGVGAIIFGRHYDMVGDDIQHELDVHNLVNQKPVSNPQIIADIVNHIFEAYQELTDMIEPTFRWNDDGERRLKNEIRQTFVNWEVFA